MKKLVMIAAVMSSLYGCSTIHFDNGKPVAESYQTSKWHHNVIAVIEASDPITLDQECADSEWTSVKTEVSFIDGLLTAATSMIAPVWQPQTVTVDCK